MYLKRQRDLEGSGMITKTPIANPHPHSICFSGAQGEPENLRF